MQLESSHHTNTRKRKASEAFDDFDYLYGIVTTATDWYFLMIFWMMMRNFAEVLKRIWRS
ncbi:hypothetical protein RhiirA4_409570 [Rhizophagus irregularis]|uniref:Uncharacterized protein n=1 Tax=Rhizophagus irregularis TaxID=588596 RepID=A0A2I1H5E4_9GLOM|nr:hypothetical protein RhiirA4_409570 [Rhizophagus irregularis]